jgi:hypothetical protein
MNKPDLRQRAVTTVQCGMRRSWFVARLLDVSLSSAKRYAASGPGTQGTWPSTCQRGKPFTI